MDPAPRFAHGSSASIMGQPTLEGFGSSRHGPISRARPEEERHFWRSIPWASGGILTAKMGVRMVLRICFAGRLLLNAAGVGDAKTGRCLVYEDTAIPAPDVVSVPFLASSFVISLFSVPLELLACHSPPQGWAEQLHGGLTPTETKSLASLRFPKISYDHEVAKRETMRLPRTPRPSGNPMRRDDDPDADSTIVDTPEFSAASIFVITIIVIAGLTALLVTGYFVLSRRYAARIASASRSSSRPRHTPTAEEEKIGGRIEVGEGRKKTTKKGPTMVFRQHEPETHGHFAPLYLEGRKGTKGPALGDVKREVSRVYEPGMLEAAMDLGKGKKQVHGVDSKEEHS